jgi:hypothetical protein
VPEKIWDDGTARKYGERLTHICYIWRRDEKNPSVITIKQIDAPPLDAPQMESLFD